MLHSKTAIFIIGPTTVGKTDVAYALARSIQGEVINGDAYEMYREFALCNGTSDALKYTDVPKHLYRILDPMAGVPSPAHYAALASNQISEITSRNIPAIVEIYQMRYLAALRAAYPDNIVICLQWKNPDSLDQRVRDRWEKASSAPLINEVRQGLEKGYRDSFVISKSLVAPYIVSYLDGDMSITDAKEGIIRDNIALAHRDFAVLHTISGVNWVEHDPLHMDETLTAIHKLISARSLHAVSV